MILGQFLNLQFILYTEFVFQDNVFQFSKFHSFFRIDGKVYSADMGPFKKYVLKFWTNLYPSLPQCVILCYSPIPLLTK
jgi:hypothetical protein